MKKKIVKMSQARLKAKRARARAKKLHPRTDLTETLYTYAKPANATFARKRAEKMGISYSDFVNGLIEAQRTNKNPKTVLKAIARAA